MIYALIPSFSASLTVQRTCEPVKCGGWKRAILLCNLYVKYNYCFFVYCYLPIKVDKMLTVCSKYMEWESKNEYLCSLTLC
jgi:hypothetical protein